MAEGWPDFLSAWEEYRAVVEEYRELDDERVLALGRYSGRGKTSGVSLGKTGSKGAAMFHIRDGKVMRIVFYFDRERAFADLDLAPETDSPRR
jgi:ketosteroid isomerase-like protein